MKQYDIAYLNKVMLTICLFFINYSLSACDMSAFDQSDFSSRCQKLIGLCEKAYIACASNHPDTDKRLSEVSKDWVDFYLSHGNRSVQPPNMSFITPEIWERNLNNLGKSFSEFLHKKVSSKDYQIMLLQINTLKSEEKLTQLHNCFKASELCETDISKINDIDLWLETRLKSPCDIIFTYITDNEELITELNFTFDESVDEIKRFYELTASETVEIKQIMFDGVNRNISENLSNWEKIFFYK